MDFHVIVTGTADEALVDDFIMKKASKLVKDLKAGNVTVESASVNSGHFLGGSKSLVEPVEETATETIETTPEEG